MTKTKSKKNLDANHKSVLSDRTDDYCREDLSDMKSKYLRALADYQNLEKRIAREKDDLKNRLTESIVRQLLPLSDILERATKFQKDDGFAMALNEWRRIHKNMGIDVIDDVGVDFDPYLMECVEMVKGQSGKVTEIVETGYRYGDRILRAAKVKVGSNMQE